MFDEDEAKNRSRLFLIIGVLIVGALIIGIRLTPSNYNNNNKSKENIKEEKENESTQNNSNIKNEINEMFYFLDGKNYEFKYELKYNDDIYVSTGKRVGEKLELSFSNNEQTLKFLSNGDITKVYREGEYTSSPLPFYYINYYDIDVLKLIINNSVKENENKYIINTNTLANITNLNYDYIVKDNDKYCSMLLELKNNKIVGMKLNLSNLFNSNEELKTLEVSMEFNNFGIVDDFIINFE